MIGHETNFIRHQTKLIGHEINFIRYETKLIGHKTNFIRHQTKLIGHEINFIRHHTIRIRFDFCWRSLRLHIKLLVSVALHTISWFWWALPTLRIFQ
ncbi:hypothetical protein Ava_0037 [Trichormus variabilis ATCC 29413]|uniref:Uncharacterized protein n=2 Tax=Anabaena variabilis TaxID=264691 RepID=Q3MH73_TRIV2|nr:MULTISPECIES: hypothetical protein [Nostocaceae]ABA19663.1 hypothetical protein Ava_0037 [Trichormus variabilis ATCC 29413]MBC1215521.1 hypothetical protein [Trichormus variabilis ARAD]MBC1256792.1 hypothetical protein [Trichormus variabilis V5]MBC1265956.1 hypothetical protein [Trichormus variabilis FSR]MBC1302230.1 hypothetical protein [Trichormus variabilis N2B]